MPVEISFPYGSGGGGGGVSGSGTSSPSTIPRWTGSTTLADSGLIDDGTQVYTTTRNFAVGTANPAARFEAYQAAASSIRSSSDTLANIGVFQYSTNAVAPTLSLRKARGTRAAQTAVATGDVIGTVQFSAYGGSTGNVLSAISGNVVTYTSDTNISSNLTFGTSAAGAVTPTTRLTIDEAGVSTFTGPVRATGTSAGAPAFTGSDTDTGLYFPANNQARISTGGSVAVAIDSSQNVGFANASPATKVDVAWGDYQTIGAIRIGADLGLLSSRTDATAKLGAISIPHYTNAQANILLAGVHSLSSSTILYVGGGLGSMNAATSIQFYTGATNTTASGTRIATVNQTGVVLDTGTATLVFNAQTSGQGIKLAATPANGDANTLDCYVEANWSPADASGAGMTLTQTGGVVARYTQIGRQVVCFCDITYPATILGGASAAAILLPVAASGAQGGHFIGGGSTALWGIVSGANLLLYNFNTLTATTNTTIGANRRLIFTLSYFVN